MEIKLCMGSSCFARGNAGLLNFLEAYAERNQHKLDIDLCGCLCEERCGDGPNLFLDGVRHSRMTLGKLKMLLGEAEEDTQDATGATGATDATGAAGMHNEQDGAA